MVLCTKIVSSLCVYADGLAASLLMRHYCGWEGPMNTVASTSDSNSESHDSNIILEHYRSRQHFAELPEPRLWGGQVNHACGDELTLYLRLSDSPPRIEEISYTGRGCSICIASADILCQELRNMEAGAARAIAESFVRYISDEDGLSEEFPGHIPALLSLRDYPIRRKCALMAWQILLELLGSH